MPPSFPGGRLPVTFQLVKWKRSGLDTAAGQANDGHRQNDERNYIKWRSSGICVFHNEDAGEHAWLAIHLRLVKGFSMSARRQETQDSGSKKKLHFN